MTSLHVIEIWKEDGGMHTGHHRHEVRIHTYDVMTSLHVMEIWKEDGGMHIGRQRHEGRIPTCDIMTSLYVIKYEKKTATNIYTGHQRHEGRIHTCDDMTSEYVIEIWKEDGGMHVYRPPNAWRANTYMWRHDVTSCDENMKIRRWHPDRRHNCIRGTCFYIAYTCVADKAPTC